MSAITATICWALSTPIRLNPATGVTPYAAQFPYLQFINEIVNDARSNYDSLQTTLTQRLSHGFNFTAGYTYGHGLDNGSLNRFGNPPQNSYNPGGRILPPATTTSGTAAVSPPVTKFPDGKASASCSKAGSSTRS